MEEKMQFPSIPSDRFRLSSSEFLHLSNVGFYLDDAVALLIAERPERPMNFLAEYFESILLGKHVCYRPYSYITATTNNRHAFVRLARNVLLKFSRSMKIVLNDYYQLLRMLCPDFDHKIFDRTAALLGVSLLEEISFESASLAVHVFFVYEDFIETALQRGEEDIVELDLFVSELRTAFYVPQCSSSAPTNTATTTTTKDNSNGSVMEEVQPVSSPFSIPPLELITALWKRNARESNESRLGRVGYMTQLLKSKELGKLLHRDPPSVNVPLKAAKLTALAEAANRRAGLQIPFERHLSEEELSNNSAQEQSKKIKAKSSSRAKRRRAQRSSSV
eukprot:g4792.t1